MTAYVQNFAFLPFAGGLLPAVQEVPSISPVLLTSGDAFRAVATLPTTHHATKLPGFGGLWRGLDGLLKRLGARTTPAPSPPEEPKAPRESVPTFTRVNITQEDGRTFVDVPGMPASMNIFEHMTAVTRDLVKLRETKPKDIEFKFYEGIERDVLIWAKWELRKHRPVIEEILKFAGVVESNGKLKSSDKERLKIHAESIAAFRMAMSASLAAWTWAGSGGTRSSGIDSPSLVDLATDYLGNVTWRLDCVAVAINFLLADMPVDTEIHKLLRVYLVPSVGDSIHAAISLSVDSLLAAGMNLNSVTVELKEEAKYILFARGEDVEMPFIDSVSQILSLIARASNALDATGKPLIRIEFGPSVGGSLPIKIRGEGFVVAQRTTRKRFDDDMMISSINNFLANYQLPRWSWSVIGGRPPEFTIGLPASELIWPEDAEFAFGEE